MSPSDDEPRAEVFKIDHGWAHPFPWSFRIHWKGRTWEFGGIPNKCRSRRSAAARAAWRCRWLKDGTFDKRYV